MSTKLVLRAAAGALVAAVIGTGLWAANAQAEPALTFYGPNDMAAFDAAIADDPLSAYEDFSDADFRRNCGLLCLSPPTSAAADDPLDASRANGPFPAGAIAAGMRFQSNADNGGMTGPNPRGRRALAVSRPTTYGDHDSPIALSSPYGASGPASLDILNVDPDRRAFAFDVSVVRFTFVEEQPAPTELIIRVFDGSGAPIGSTAIAQDDLGPFVGIVAPAGVTIGRINLSEVGGAELLYSVAAFGGDAAPPSSAPPSGGLLCPLLGLC